MCQFQYCLGSDNNQIVSPVAKHQERTMMLKNSCILNNLRAHLKYLLTCHATTLVEFPLKSELQGAYKAL